MTARTRNLLLVALLLLGFVRLCFAITFHTPRSNDTVLGEIQHVTVQPNDTLHTLARRYEMGLNALKLANPSFPAYSHLKADEPATIPSFFVLPNVKEEGIVVNLPELRLYFYGSKKNIIITEPISVGRRGWPTPEFTGRIVEKIVDPEWRVPEAIWDYSAAKGIILPKILPAGPNNPLGQFALRLNAYDILIHGTNQPTLIGKRVSSGCIRMYPEDIAELFPEVSLETPVYIIDEPYKVGWYRNQLYLEVHPPLSESRGTDEEERQKVYSLIENAIAHSQQPIDWEKVDHMVQEPSGIPEQITISGAHRENALYWQRALDTLQNDAGLKKDLSQQQNNAGLQKDLSQRPNNAGLQKDLSQQQNNAALQQDPLQKT